jgi:CelD/BcsL family acetyltransferase involved in cellulose biosynthesis
VAVPQWQIRLRRPSELTEPEQRAWAALEGRAVEPNAFLSPHFVLPALRYLDPTAKVMLLWVERLAAGGRQVVAVGVFRGSPGTRAFPWPHLVAYQSEHTYLGGMLVDAEVLVPVVEQIQHFLQRRLSPWKGLELPKLRADGPLAQAFRALATQQQLPAQLLGPQARSMLTLADCGEALLNKALGKKLNEINRCKRRLEEMGTLTWECLWKDGVPKSSVDAFLALEHRGWKGESGTSLQSTEAGREFFREMVRRFDGDGRRALFTELRLNGEAVASTCNFVSGTMGFAFKVGWDPDLRKLGPGMLNEVEFIRRFKDHPNAHEITAFDSGASADSFINRLWLDQRSLGLLLMPSSRMAGLALHATRRLRESRQGMAPQDANNAIVAKAEA